MSDSTLLAVLAAMNEVLVIDGFPTIDLTHDIASRIGWHIKRHERDQERRVTRNKLSTPALSSPTAAGWRARINTEFVLYAGSKWQILGLDHDGKLYGRVLNKADSFVGKAVPFDSRARPRPITDARLVREIESFLMQSGDDSGELRLELKLTTEGLF